MTPKENLSPEQIPMFASRHGIEGNEPALIGFICDVQLHGVCSRDEAPIPGAAESAVAVLDAQADARRAEDTRPVPPRWYTHDEVLSMLKNMNYCDQIAEELASWTLRHLQLAFNKGFEKGARDAQAQGVPTGFKLVPIQPTGVMKDAGHWALPVGTGGPWTASSVYQAMLEQAPSAPSQDSERLGETGTSTSPLALSKAEQDVIAERRRQVSVEGWTPEHDDELDTGTLASAAMSYIAFAADLLHPMSQGDGFRDAEGKPPMWWPFDASWWKPTTPRRALEKGVALALAEIEHIDRAAEAKRSRAR